MLTECLVLAMAGGALGALLAAAGVSLVKHLATIEAPGIFRMMFGATILPRGNEVGVDLKVFGIAFGIATTRVLRLWSAACAAPLATRSSFRRWGRAAAAPAAAKRGFARRWSSDNS